MRRRTYAGVVAGLAAALLAGGTNTAAAADDYRILPLAPGAATEDVGPAAAPGRFAAISPIRVLDTRNGTGAPAAPVGPRGTITLDLSGLPLSTTAVVLNVTGTAPTAATFVTVYPEGTPQPLASNLNLVPGQTRPNAVTVSFEGSRRINLYNNAGSVHLVADLAGYYATDAASGFAALAPARVLDTRSSGGPLGPGGTVTVDLSTTGLVPPSATAVTFNLTGVGATANTFVTAWPAGTPRPTASNLNLRPGEVAPNQVTVALGANRRISLFNNAGSTHLIVDLAGYYTIDGGWLFYPEVPWRALDTRPDQGLGAGEAAVLIFDQDLPSTAGAVTFNLTGTNPTGSTFVTVWPPDAPFPNASSLNLVPGQTAPNLVTVALGPFDEFSKTVGLYNNAGYVDLIIDVAGYFAP